MNKMRIEANEIHEVQKTKENQQKKNTHQDESRRILQNCISSFVLSPLEKTLDHANANNTNSLETTIMERLGAQRQLERVIIFILQ